MRPERRLKGRNGRGGSGRPGTIRPTDPHLNSLLMEIGPYERLNFNELPIRNSEEASLHIAIGNVGHQGMQLVTVDISHDASPFKSTRVRTFKVTTR